MRLGDLDLPPGPGPVGTDPEDPGLAEHHLLVGRSARFVTLGDPAADLREVWFVCHGYRQLAGRFLRAFRVLDDGSRLLVAPEALNRMYLEDDGGPHGPDAPVGATWMTRHDRRYEIRDQVNYLERLHQRVSEAVRGGPEVHVLGFSQGAATVCRWAAYGSARIDRLILWSGYVPPDLEPGEAAARLRRMRLTLVHGSEDPYASEERIRAEDERLEAAGIPFRRVTVAGGHRIEPEALEAVAAAGREPWGAGSLPPAR